MDELIERYKNDETLKRYVDGFNKISDICEGTIKHLDRDDMRDMLYDIKSIIRKVNNND